MIAARQPAPAIEFVIDILDGRRCALTAWTFETRRAIETAIAAGSLPALQRRQDYSQGSMGGPLAGSSFYFFREGDNLETIRQWLAARDYPYQEKDLRVELAQRRAERNPQHIKSPALVAVA